MNITEINDSILTKDTHTYELDLFTVTQNGLEKVKDEGVRIELVKGSRDENDPKQDGILTQQLLAVALRYLNSVNVGDMRNKDTSIAITSIETAMLRLDNRQRDRSLRNVAQTYNK